MNNDEEFLRRQVCYEQNFEQARSLNTQMNNVPMLAMTITGGLWFGAGVTANLYPEIRFGLLLFAGFSNIALILATLRIRDVFHSYLEQIEKFYPPSYASGKPKEPKVRRLDNYSMVYIYCTLMAIGSFLSFFGAFGFYWPFTFNPWFGAATLFIFLVVLYCILFKPNKQTGGG